MEAKIKPMSERATNDVDQVVQFLTLMLTVIVSAPVMFIVGMVMALAQSVSLRRQEARLYLTEDWRRGA